MGKKRILIVDDEPSLTARRILPGKTFENGAQKTLKEGFAVALLEKPMRLPELTRIVSENLPNPR